MKHSGASSRLPMFWKVLLALTLLLMAGGIVFVLVARSVFSSRAQRQLQALRAAGYPVSVAEADRWYPAVPDAENAALVFEGAFAKLREAPTENGRSVPLVGRYGALPEAPEPIPAEALAEMAAWVGTNTAALVELRRGAALKASRYPVDLKLGFAAPVNHLSPLKKTGQLLATEAVLRAEQGDAEGAVQSWLTLAALARSLDAEPLLISQLVRYASWGLAWSALEQVLGRVQLDDAQLARLAEAAASAEVPNALERALAGERALGLEIFEVNAASASTVFSGGGPPVPPAAAQKSLLGFRAMRAFGILQRDEAFYLGIMDDAVAAAKQPHPQRLRDTVTVDKRLDAEARRKYYVLSAMLLPAVMGGAQKDATHAARARCALIALRVERYRLAHGGTLPASLADLGSPPAGAAAADPFTGEPLRYLRAEPGYKVYSVGENLQDDGGSTARPKGTSRAREADVVFRVGR